MNVRGKANFGDQSDPLSWGSAAVGLLKVQLQMGSVDGIRDFFTQLGEELCNYVVTRKPFPILRFEEFFADYALGVDKEITGSRHAVVLPSGFDIHNMISAKDLRLRVGEQWKIDFSAIGEILQDRLSIVADRRELDALGFEPRFGLLQLNQLRLAVGSPICRTEKQQNGSVRAL